MPALVPIRFGSSPEGTPKRPLVAGISSGGSCVVGPISGTTPFDGLTATGAFSASRKLSSTFAGDIYLADGLKRIDTLYDQSGNSRNLMNVGGTSQSPSVVCFNSSPVNALQYVSGQLLRSIGFAFSDFVTATDGYMIVTAIVTEVLNDCILAASSWPLSNGGLFLLTTGPDIAAYNTNGETVSAPISIDTAYVFEWRHESGQVYLRVNGAGEINTGAGIMNPVTLSFPLNLGGQFLGVGLTGYIFEAGFFSAVPNLATRDALVQDMGLWAGAAV